MGGKRPREQFYPEEDAGVNSKFTLHNVRLYQLPRIELRDPNQVQLRIAEYFKICVEDDMRPSFEGLSLAFGWARKSVWYFMKENGERYKESCNAIRKAHTMIGAMLADYMTHNKINPVAGIFLLKNSYGYTEGNELPALEENSSGQKSLEELRRQYLSLGESKDHASLATEESSASE